MEEVNNIVKRIKKRRLELEYSFQDLADKTNMSKYGRGQ
nr:MAG TPA: POU domain, class 6, transcription-DNA complex, Helix-turn-helix (HTH), DNA-binding.51A [Caudoviricetes sp.]